VVQIFMILSFLSINTKFVTWIGQWLLGTWWAAFYNWLLHHAAVVLYLGITYFGFQSNTGHPCYYRNVFSVHWSLQKVTFILTILGLLIPLNTHLAVHASSLPMVKGLSLVWPFSWQYTDQTPSSQHYLLSHWFASVLLLAWHVGW